MKIPSNATKNTKIKAPTAYMPHLLCLSVKTNRMTVYFVGVICARMQEGTHELIYKNAYPGTHSRVYCVYTHSLDTEFLFHDVQDLTATPAEIVQIR